MKRPTKVTVVQNEKKPVERGVLAQAVIRISEAADALRRSSGLNDRALVLLVADSSKVGKPDVKAVLDALQNLRRDYCR